MSNYHVLPSAAVIAEAPLYYATAACYSYNAGYVAIGYLSGLIALPISIASTPVTIVADIVIGIGEAIIAASKGTDKNEIQEILFKKVIASPIQQLVSTIIKIVSLLVFPFWFLGYLFGEQCIESLPDCINHKRINIFINDGTRDIALRAAITRANSLIQGTLSIKCNKQCKNFIEKIKTYPSAQEILGHPKNREELGLASFQVKENITSRTKGDNEKIIEALINCIDRAYWQLFRDLPEDTPFPVVQAVKGTFKLPQEPRHDINGLD